MRRPILVFILVTLLLATFLLHTVSTLLSLLIEDAAADAIQKSELPAPNSTLLSQRPQVVPKIIHQTYKNTTIPAAWRAAQQSCIDLHPDYEYNLWTDAKAEDFIRNEYPWFLATFLSYEHPIQRADSIRYFVLSHYGGVYIDLDDGCHRRLDPLLSYTAFVRRTIPTGISNDVMGCIPQHPFFLRVIESLQGANRKWFLPYITIMASTGPLFLSLVWKKWMTEHASLINLAADGAEWTGRVRVLMPDEYRGHSWSFFDTYMGNSWHGGDARFIFWMGRNWMLLTASGFVLAATLGLGIWWVYGRILLLGQRRKGFVLTSPHLVAARPRAPNGTGKTVPLWRKWRPASGEFGGKIVYELIEQHDA